jgi:hypothetical protein
MLNQMSPLALAVKVKVKLTPSLSYRKVSVGESSMTIRSRRNDGLENAETVGARLAKLGSQALAPSHRLLIDSTYLTIAPRSGRGSSTRASYCIRRCKIMINRTRRTHTIEMRKKRKKN